MIQLLECEEVARFLATSFLVWEILHFHFGRL